VGIFLAFSLIRSLLLVRRRDITLFQNEIPPRISAEEGIKLKKDQEQSTDTQGES